MGNSPEIYAVEGMSFLKSTRYHFNYFLCVQLHIYTHTHTHTYTHTHTHTHTHTPWVCRWGCGPTPAACWSAAPDWTGRCGTPAGSPPHRWGPAWSGPPPDAASAVLLCPAHRQASFLETVSDIQGFCEHFHEKTFSQAEIVRL